MTQLDILLPFGLLPPQFGGDLLRVLKTPALATLLCRTSFGHGGFHTESFDEFSRALPHETWSARRFGLDAGSDAKEETGGSPPLASAAMHAFGLDADGGFWFAIHPVHIHVARDHLVLTDRRQLQLAEAEARSLFDAARTLFEDAGKVLLYGSAASWFARADDWSGLQTSTPDAACGHSVDIWMPKGDAALQWRKLQNEVQMEWFAHPLNEERQARGQKPVNSIWLWGGAPATQDSTADTYREVFNLPDDMAAYGQAAACKTDCDAAAVIAAAPQRGLLVLDALVEAALAGDWSYWLERMHALERDWFAPLLLALQSGRIERLTLVCSNGTHLAEATASTRSLKKFWIKPSLARLQP
jgi:hypothetical protein